MVDNHDGATDVGCSAQLLTQQYIWKMNFPSALWRLSQKKHRCQEVLEPINVPPSPRLKSPIFFPIKCNFPAAFPSSSESVLFIPPRLSSSSIGISRDGTIKGGIIHTRSALEEGLPAPLERCPASSGSYSTKDAPRQRQEWKITGFPVGKGAPSGGSTASRSARPKFCFSFFCGSVSLSRRRPSEWIVGILSTEKIGAAEVLEVHSGAEEGLGEWLRIPEAGPCCVKQNRVALLRRRSLETWFLGSPDSPALMRPWCRSSEPEAAPLGN